MSNPTNVRPVAPDLEKAILDAFGLIADVVEVESPPLFLTAEEAMERALAIRGRIAKEYGVAVSSICAHDYGRLIQMIRAKIAWTIDWETKMKADAIGALLGGRSAQAVRGLIAQHDMTLGNL